MALQMTDRIARNGRRIYKVRENAVSCALCECTIPIGTEITKGIAGDSWAHVCQTCRPIEPSEPESAPNPSPFSHKTSETIQDFATWAIVELMGRQKIAGKVSEKVVAGQPLLRIDVPAVGDEAAFTRFYSGRALYAITPVAESIAIAAAHKIKKDPIVVWGVRTPELEAGEPADYGEYDPQDTDVGPVDDEWGGDEDDVGW